MSQLEHGNRRWNLGGRVRGQTYLAALMALGLGGGMVFGEEGGQAIDPVNISGTRRPAATVVSPQATAPAVAAPSATAPAAEPPVQAVTPPDVSKKTIAPVAPAASEEIKPAEVKPVAPPVSAGPEASAERAAAPAGVEIPVPSGTVVWPNDVAAIEPDGISYPVTELKINYYRENAGEPRIEELLNTPVNLGVVKDGYVAPRAGVPTISIKLGEIGKGGPEKIYRSGIASVYNAVVRFYNQRGIIGVFVVVDSKDIDASDRDIRPPERQWLQLIVVTSRVAHIRTLATGGQVKDENRVNNPRYKAILDDSPLKADGTPEGRMDLLKKDSLDDYVLWLNRHPGRRVDVAISGTDQPGDVNLDYLVSEAKSWYAYAQMSNTGTPQTQTWRERFGVVDNQLTGHDDIFTVDYLTAGFYASQDVTASYELPVPGVERLRAKGYASYNEYTSSDVGQNQENFTGQEWSVGVELTKNIFQHRELFLDLVGGVKYLSEHASNQTTEVTGDANYIVPYIGLKMDRLTDIASTTASVMLLSYETGAQLSDIEGLGRTSPTRNPFVLQYEFSQSAYLEPLLFPEDFVAGRSTLAHEVYVAAHGQWAFNSRLFPQAEEVAGGFYTVRGYPESITAGDSVVIATGEYRFHLPRMFAVQSDPSKTPFLWDKSFRFSPSQPYGRPDWDLIARTFIDVAEVVNSGREIFETNSTLVGTGVGLEFQYKQNFNVRIDWGMACTNIPNQVQAGDNRVHLSFTVLY